MISCYFVCYPEHCQATSATSEVLQFNVPCGVVNPHDYGLTTADISFTREVHQSETRVIGTLQSTTGSPLFFTIISNGEEIGHVPACSPLTIERPPDCYHGQNCPFIITYVCPNTGGKLIYNLLFIDGSGTGAHIARVRGNVGVQEHDEIPFPNPEPELPQTILGTISLTNDKQMICQLDYEVNESFSGCCLSKQKCEPGLIHRSSVYKRYHVELQKVMKGTGCTVFARFESILAHGKSADYNSLLQYSMLRLVLSSILTSCKAPEFGRFSVELMRRRYNEEFKALLKASQFAEKYYGYFDDSDVSDYWCYFKQ
jgi:hypothetical protein